jgi:hypothetical protein
VALSKDALNVRKLPQIEREIAKFTEKHGVNVEWLLEGQGEHLQEGPGRTGAACYLAIASPRCAGNAQRPGATGGATGNEGPRSPHAGLTGGTR